MNVSLKEVIENIQTLVKQQIPEIKECEYNLPDGINKDDGDSFPRLDITWEVDGNILENINQVPLLFTFSSTGRMNDNETISDKEIHSDCLQYASKLLDLLQCENYFNGTLNEPVTPFFKKYNSGLSGIQVRPTLIMQKPGIDV